MRAFRRELEHNPNSFEAAQQLGTMYRSTSGTRRRCDISSAPRPCSRTTRSFVRIWRRSTLEWARPTARGNCSRIVADTPAYIDAHVLLATTYYRLKGKDDGDRERQIVEKLTAEAQAKQPKPEGPAAGTGDRCRPRRTLARTDYAHATSHSSRVARGRGGSPRHLRLRAIGDAGQAGAARLEATGRAGTWLGRALCQGPRRAGGQAGRSARHRCHHEAGRGSQADRKLDEALALYAKAIRLQPSLIEAHWYVGVINYDQDRYEPARNAFRRVTELSPEKGEAWTLKGLCEFQLKNYESALTDLVNGRRFGFGGNPEIVSVARYHLAVLLTRDRGVRPGREAAERVCERRQRRAARDRGDGNCHTADAAAAQRSPGCPP